MLSGHHLHIVRKSSAHLPELPNFMQYYTWCHPHVIHRHTSSLHIICMSSAHTYVIPMSSACHPHTSLSCQISCSTTPGVICMSSADIMSSACHLHIICMSSAHHLQMCTSFAHHVQMYMSSLTVLMDPNCISCAKDISY